MLGNDVRKMSSQTFSIIANKEVIGINQGQRHLLVAPWVRPLWPVGCRGLN